MTQEMQRTFMISIDGIDSPYTEKKSGIGPCVLHHIERKTESKYLNIYVSLPLVSITSISGISFHNPLLFHDK
jgi:hypothetical protein